MHSSPPSSSLRQAWVLSRVYLNLFLVEPGICHYLLFIGLSLGMVRFFSTQPQHVMPPLFVTPVPPSPSKQSGLTDGHLLGKS
jgi:hypothetical protein